MTERNPWKATTLEWTSPVERIHGNWPGKLPSVQRWAYDYGKDGKDFIPQVEPIGPDEKEVH
jgi:cytochrome c oxidase subunit 1